MPKFLHSASAATDVDNDDAKAISILQVFSENSQAENAHSLESTNLG